MTALAIVAVAWPGNDSFTIGTHRVGPDEPAMVIAEMAELGAFIGPGPMDIARPHRLPFFVRGVVGQEGVAEGRVQGQLGQDGAVRGDAPVRVHRVEGGERALGGGHRVGRRVLGQGQPAAARGAPRRERQGHRREVDDGEGRRRGCGSGAQGRGGVAADHGAGAEAGGAARPLAGGRTRCLDGDETGHAPPPVPARLAGQARVDDEAHPRHGQRGLGDRRRDDDARHGGVGAAGERGVLVGGFLAAVQDADLGVRGERGDAIREP